MSAHHVFDTTALPTGPDTEGAIDPSRAGIGKAAHRLPRSGGLA
jgi:hypothetical protein